jgi:hypothetical protein
MNDLLSLARRLLEYADEPGTDERKQEDLRLAADALRAFNTMLSGEAGRSAERVRHHS